MSWLAVGRCLVFAAGLTSLGATAQMAPPATNAGASGPCQLPDLLAAWQAPAQSVPNLSGRQAADAAHRTEQPVRVALRRCADDWCKPGSWVGMVKFNTPVAGRYRVAVDQMVWIDLYSTDHKLEGMLCEHSGCQPIRKIVQFDVQSGVHWVTLMAHSAAEVGILVSQVKP